MARKFYYDTGEEKLGPIKGLELLELHAQGVITDDTWVRRDDSQTWRKMADADLREEREEAARPKSIWQILWSQLTVSSIITILCVLVIIAAICYMGFVFLKAFWPILLLLIVVWMVYRALSRA